MQTVGWLAILGITVAAAFSLGAASTTPKAASASRDGWLAPRL
jgi:hypothetical protein